MFTLIPIVLGLVALILGGVFLFIGWRGKKQSDASRSWPSVPGRVTAATMRTSTSYDHDTSPSTSYQPVVEYDYTVMGAAYHASRVAFGADSFGKGQAEAILARYPVDTHVTVYYNPEKPGEAVLEQSAKSTTLFMVVGGIFALIGLCASLAGCAALAYITLAMSTGQ
jgi:hypothetical protein